MRDGRELRTVDAVLAVALAVASQLEVWAPRAVPGVGEVVGDRPLLAVTSLAATLPLALRRSHPLGVLIVVMGALAVQQLLTTPTEGLVLLIAAMVAAYSASAYSSPSQAAIGGGVVVVGAAFLGEHPGDDWAFLVIILGGAWLVGFVVMRHATDLGRARQDNRELAVRLADAADQLALAQRRLVSGPPPDELASLTAREIEVTRAVATGMSNAEIAAELSISEWTVKTHVASILRKLGLRDRTQVVVAAYEAGLVSPRSTTE
jgi:DNA-binding CsgD family transcriptional regulator